MRKNRPMVSECLIKSWKKYMLLGALIFAIPFFITLAYLLSISRRDLIVIAGVIFLAVFMLAVLSLYLNYLRWPYSILIRDAGIEYVSTSKKRRLIPWRSIVSIDTEKCDVYIVYSTWMGKVALPIINDIGIKIKEAWEEWKKQNKENARKEKTDWVVR